VEDDSLAEGETAEAGRDFRRGGRFAGAGFSHWDIVAGVESRRCVYYLGG
jgi:hypothetical protein